MGLIDELKKTGGLQGEELDAALLGIKEKYNSPADRETIKTYLIGECREICMALPTYQWYKSAGACLYAQQKREEHL